MHEYYEFVSLVSKQENGFFFYMVDKDGIKSTSKFVEKKDNIVISPIRAKSGYILIEEKDTKKKTYYLRLEKMDF